MRKLKKPDMELVKTFLWLLKICFKEAPVNSTIYLLSSIMQIGTNIFTYYATARISGLLVEIVSGQGSTGELRKWFFIWVPVSLTSYGMYRIMSIQQTFIYYKLAQWSTRTFFGQLCNIDMSDFYDTETRNEINRISSGFSWQVPNTGTNALSMVQSTINTIATIITVGTITWWLIPLFVLLIIPTYIYESKIAKIGWFVWDEKNDNQHIFWGLQSIFTQAKHQFEIRALTSSGRLLGIARKLNENFYSRQEVEVKKYNRQASLSVVLQFLREGIGQAWLLSRAVGGRISLEQYFFYLGIIHRLDGALSGLFTEFARSQEGLKYSNDYRLFMRHSPKLIDSTSAHLVSDKQPPMIEFVNASFTYPGASEPALQKLNLKIDGGRKVAIVGENGAGKSTIIKLLMRFYKLDSGQLLINGEDILDINIKSWLEQVATLFQEFNHYPLTIEENISISSDKKDDKRVQAAASLAGSDSYIEELPHKYKTYLDPAFKNGVEPSGGMWQRIALSRAFYRNANVIILDEPTSAIDAKAEYEIFNNIFSEHDGKTALIISHRFSTVRKADRIVVIEHGKIIEDGTHKDLLSLGGTYAEMFNKQAEGYR